MVSETSIQSLILKSITDGTKFVDAQHEFHDAAFVQGWADRFVSTAPRIPLFDLILEHVAAPGLPNTHVLELGLGPGYGSLRITYASQTRSLPVYLPRQISNFYLAWISFLDTLRTESSACSVPFAKPAAAWSDDLGLRGAR
jgi:hypothetical protein